VEENVTTVQGIYEAFGRGDIPAILDTLAPDIRWEYWPEGNGAGRRGVTWLVQRHGPAEVGEFFASLAALDFHDFRPAGFLVGERRVAALIDVDVSVRATGARFRDSEIHLWSFDDDGRVTEFRHYVDTAKHLEAVGAVPAPA
jgi:ketosteroid isomerase-like protein